MSMTRNETINDLIRNRPKGPGRETITYEVNEEYCYDSSRYKQIATPSDRQYGYTDEELFDLDFIDRNQVDSYLRKRDFEGQGDWTLGRKKATLTRRVNRLWSRIDSAVDRVKREGGRGVYKVKESRYRGNALGHVFAATKAEAEITAKIYFGYLVEDQDRMGVEYMRRGSVTEMQALNEKLVSGINDNIERAEKEMRDLQKRVDLLKARKETLATVESQQTAVEMVNTLDALEA